MVNQHGNAIACDYKMAWGYWMMWCNNGLVGEVALHNLPANLNMLYLASEGNDISKIVAMNGPNRHNPFIVRLFIDTGDSQRPFNQFIEVACPEGTRKAVGNEGRWGLRTINGNIQCTYP